MSDQWFPAASEPSVLGRFRTHQVLDIPKSREKDEHIYKEVIILETKISGHVDTSAQRLKPENRKALLTRFPDAWAAFEGEEFVFDPKALEGLGLSDDQISHLAIDGIRTKEQVAALTDAQCQTMGFGWRKIRDTAKKQLQEAKESRLGAVLQDAPPPVKRAPRRPRKRP